MHVIPKIEIVLFSINKYAIRNKTLCKYLMSKDKRMFITLFRVLNKIYKKKKLTKFS